MDPSSPKRSEVIAKGCVYNNSMCVVNFSSKSVLNGDFFFYTKASLKEAGVPHSLVRKTSWTKTSYNLLRLHAFRINCKTMAQLVRNVGSETSECRGKYNFK